MREPSKVFICYRRRDSFVASGFHIRLKAALHNLGFDEVFLDVDPITGPHPQEDYESKAFHAVEKCDLFVVLIGTNWLNLLEEKKDERDASTREIRAGMHFEKEILPVLVDGAIMPE